MTGAEGKAIFTTKVWLLKSRQDDSPYVAMFAIYSLLHTRRMYNAASVLMRHLSRNARSVTAPAALTQCNSYLTASPETYSAGMEHARSGTYGR